MRKYLASLLLIIGMALPAIGAGFIDYRALDTNKFTTNAFIVSLRSNLFVASVTNNNITVHNNAQINTLNATNLTVNGITVIGGPTVAAGTNITTVTNGNLVTVSVSNTNLPVVSAGSNVSVVTNGLNYTVAASAPGQSVSAGTNITAVTNGSVVTLSVSTNAVVIAGTNVTVQTNGLAYTVNASSSGITIGPGTVSYIPLWLPGGTNITNSIIVQRSTNLVEMITVNTNSGTSTNGLGFQMTHEFTNPTNFASFRIDSPSNNNSVVAIHQVYGAGKTDVPIGITLQDAWNINGLGTVAAGGHNGDLFPVADNAIVIGKSSARVKSMTAVQYFTTPSSTVPGYASYGGGRGLGFDTGSTYMYNGDGSTKDAILFSTGLPGFAWDMGLGGIAGGNTVGSPKAFFIGLGNGLWMVCTNNTLAALPPAGGIIGSVATGTDHSGGDTHVSGGTGTGTGTNGAVRIRTGESSTTGSTANTLKDRVWISGKTFSLTTNTANSICTITLPTSISTIGMKVYATTEINNGTDMAYITEIFMVGAYNKAGTMTTKVGASASPLSDGSGGAGVSTTWTATVSSTTITLKNNPITTGINATKTNCRIRIECDSSSATLAINDI